ncbi:MAG: hypothetical protein ACYDAO_07240 [Thermoplasmataceae archaeon]
MIVLQETDREKEDHTKENHPTERKVTIEKENQREEDQITPLNGKKVLQEKAVILEVVLKESSVLMVVDSEKKLIAITLKKRDDTLPEIGLVTQL